MVPARLAQDDPASWVEMHDTKKVSEDGGLDLVVGHFIRARRSSSR